MEVMSPRPAQEFLLLDSAGAGAYTPKSAIMNPFAASTVDDVAAGNNPFLLATTAVTAPPSPNPFEQLPPGADPFDLFQHFTSAPASPARAAAIYAQFDSVNIAAGDDGGKEDVVDDDDVGFQPRVSYSMSKPMVASAVRVPFDWEEKPGKPKAEFAGVSATTTVDQAGEMADDDDDDTDFDFGVLLDKASAQAQELTTADELFDEGKIRPLKPPPRLLECGSVGSSSPRSARSVMWSPRLRSRLTGPGSANANLDPFAAALVKAANAPSYPHGAGGAKHDAGSGGSASSPMVPGAATSPHSTPPATGNGGGGRKKWRLRDLLLFRRATKGRTAGNISKDPVFKYAPVQVQQLATPVKTASAGHAAANAGDASAGKRKKQSKKAAPAEGGGMPMMPQRQNLMMGCVRLSPGLHRLAKGFHGQSAHLGGRGAARSAT